MKTFEEIYETIPGNGWLSKDEAVLLWDEAGRTTGKILEVGCYQGRATVLLASLGRPVISVDPFDNFDSALGGDEIAKMFQRNLRERKISNVTLARCRIEDWTPCKVGFAYLDGDHEYQGTLDQIEKALLCKPQTIAIHDVNDDGGGLLVKQAAVYMLGAWTERVERLAVWRLS